MKAIRRNLRISPKKVNLVASLVRGMPVENAINMLTFTPKRGARPMMELIKSAAANAVANFKQKRDTLFVQQIVVNEGSTFKRFNPVSRGRSHPILKRTSHIIVELGVQTAVTTKKPASTKSSEKKSPVGAKAEVATKDTTSSEKTMPEAAKKRPTDAKATAKAEQAKKS